MTSWAAAVASRIVLMSISIAFTWAPTPEDPRTGLGDAFPVPALPVATPPKGIKRGFEAFGLLGLRAEPEPPA